MAKFHLAATVSFSHCHGLLGHLNRTEPLLMLTPVLFLLWQVKMSAVKDAYQLEAANSDKVIKFTTITTSQYDAVQFQRYLIPDQSCNLSAASRYEDIRQSWMGHNRSNSKLMTILLHMKKKLTGKYVVFLKHFHIFVHLQNWKAPLMN